MIIFVSGIHGSGKGTLCKKMSAILNIPHFSSSDVLNWAQFSPNIKNKNVQNISETQQKLISNLQLIKEKYRSFILDGHFCLFDKNGTCQKIDLNVFEAISPQIIISISIEIKEIKSRLAERDDVDYSFLSLSRMQKIELDYSQEVANELENLYLQYNGNNLEELINQLNQYL